MPASPASGRHEAGELAIHYPRTAQALHRPLRILLLLAAISQSAPRILQQCDADGACENTEPRLAASPPASTSPSSPPIYVRARCLVRCLVPPPLGSSHSPAPALPRIPLNARHTPSRASPLEPERAGVHIPHNHTQSAPCFNLSLSHTHTHTHTHTHYTTPHTTPHTHARSPQPPPPPPTPLPPPSSTTVSPPPST